jgi:hypothetical protein
MENKDKIISLLLGIIGFFVIKIYDRVESIYEKQHEFDVRVTKIESKIFSVGESKSESDYMRLFAVLPEKKRERKSTPDPLTN